MKDVFARLGSDFLSTIVFLALYLSTGDVILATVGGDRGRDRPGDLRPLSRANRSAS